MICTHLLLILLAISVAEGDLIERSVEMFVTWATNALLCIGAVSTILFVRNFICEFPEFRRQRRLMIEQFERLDDLQRQLDNEDYEEIREAANEEHWRRRRESNGSSSSDELPPLIPAEEWNDSHFDWRPNPNAPVEHKVPLLGRMIKVPIQRNECEILLQECLTEMESIIRVYSTNAVLIQDDSLTQSAFNWSMARYMFRIKDVEKLVNGKHLLAVTTCPFALDMPNAHKFPEPIVKSFDWINTHSRNTDTLDLDAHDSGHETSEQENNSEETDSLANRSSSPECSDKFTSHEIREALASLEFGGNYRPAPEIAPTKWRDEEIDWDLLASTYNQEEDKELAELLGKKDYDLLKKQQTQQLQIELMLEKQQEQDIAYDHEQRRIQRETIRKRGELRRAIDSQKDY